MSKTKPVTLTINEDVIKQGKEQAKKEHRSFSNYVEYLILQAALKKPKE